jgi:hypothetical protein
MTAGEVTKLVGVIANAFPGRFAVTADNAQGVAQVWHRMLGDLPAEECYAAVEELLTTALHPPGIGDIRRLVATRRVGAPDEAAAWEEVRLAIGRCGRDKEPEWSHPVIAEAVSALGWVTICNSNIDAEMATRAHFRGFYQSRIEHWERGANVESMRRIRADRQLEGKNVGQLVGEVLANMGGGTNAK